MAKLKVISILKGLSGKIGGQSLSFRKDGTTIRNITQTNTVATASQSLQRFSTAVISSHWRALTSDQKASYYNEAPSYLYVDSFGNAKARTGYGLYLFLWQNAKLLGRHAPLIAPPFEQITSPIVYLVDKTSTDFVIKADIVDSEYNYYIYCDADLATGQRPSIKTEKNIGVISSAELQAGYNVAGFMRTIFGALVDVMRSAVRVVAISMITGNRDDFVNWVYVLPVTTLISSVRGYVDVYAVGMSQDGLQQFSKTYTGTGQTRLMSNAFDFNPSDVLVSNSLFRPNMWQFRYSNDGMHLYTLNYFNAQVDIAYYSLANAYDPPSLTPNFNFILPGGNNPANFYLSIDGVIIIASTGIATYKLQLSTPFDLSTAVIIENDPTQKAFFSTQGFYSNDGLTYFESVNYIFSQYQLLTPFQVTGRKDNLVKTLDLQFYVSLPLAVQQSIWFDYSGNYLLFSQRGAPAGLPNLFLFRLASPWNL